MYRCGCTYVLMCIDVCMCVYRCGCVCIDVDVRMC